MESRVLPHKDVAPLLTEYFVCAKINVDKPPAAAQKLFEKVNGSPLPFYIYVAPDGTFISNTRGYRSDAEFKADLERVLTHPSVRTPPEQEKKLQADVAKQIVDTGGDTLVDDVTRRLEELLKEQAAAAELLIS